jgi:uncharacterized delta-60 repeat protein
MINRLQKKLFILCAMMALTACGNGGSGNSLVPDTSAGSLDATFGSDGKATTAIGSGDDKAYAVALQSDGKIVSAGASSNGTNWDFALVRYNTDGSLDGSFGTGGKTTTDFAASNDYAYAVAIQSDGKIVAAGASSNGVNLDFAAVRYNADGSLDGSFGTGGKVTTAIGTGDEYANAVVIQSDDKIVAVGSSSNGSNLDFAAVRYHADGSLDGSFGTAGMVTTDFVSSDDYAYAAALQTDGKIVAAGQSSSVSNRDFALVRYDTDGNLDTSFGTGGKVTTGFGTSDDYAYAVTLQSNDKIVAAGASDDGTGSDFALVRYNSNGGLDTSFNTTGMVTTPLGTGDDFAHAVAIQSDDKIVTAGSSYNGVNDDYALVHYNSNGSLDTDFNTAGIVTNSIGTGDDFALGMVIQSDGKIVAAGYSYNGTNYDFSIARYWP